MCVRRALEVMRDIAIVGLPAVGVIALALRQWRGSDVWQLALVAGAPYLMLLVPVGVVVALAFRRWWMAAVSVVIAAACAFTQAPLYIAVGWPVTEARINVMTQNTDLGRASADDIVQAVRRHDVDALIVTELTPPMRDQLRLAGLEKDLPFSGLRPEAGARGTGIWSRTRLDEVREVSGFACAFVTARIRVDWDHQTAPVRLVGLHLIGPTWDVAGWRSDAERLPSTLRRFTKGSPTIVAGDFNATPDSPWLRAALNSGFTNAADSAGAGLVRTYPTDYPVLAIDHVLTNKLVAQSVVRVKVAGTDHRGIVATLAYPVS